MNRFVVSIGTNSNDREVQIVNCYNWIKNTFNNCKFSTYYNTKALNGRDSDYLNGVSIFYSTENYESLNKVLKDYEKKSGRTPNSRLRGIVPIDLDIVIYNDNIIREKDYNCDYFQIGWKELNSDNL